MKKFLSLALAAVLAVSLAGCSGQTEQSSSEQAQERLTVQVGGLKGPTAMGMVKLMEDEEAGSTQNDYVFTLAGAPDEITAKLVKGELDIAALPTNAAAALYQKTDGAVQLAALNTLGVLYVVENGDTVQSVADLKGKTVYATGKGSTPEFALNYILKQNGMQAGTDVTVEYKTEHAELATLLAAGQANLAVLPQPFVSSVLAKNSDVRIALDLTKEWDAVTEDGSVLTMGALAVRRDFAQEHPEAVQAFLEEYSASTAYVTAPENLRCV